MMYFELLLVCAGILHFQGVVKSLELGLILELKVDPRGYSAEYVQKRFLFGAADIFCINAEHSR